MQIEVLSKKTFKASVFSVAIITALFSAIIYFSYYNLLAHENLQLITFHNRFQSRLTYKAISGILKTKYYLNLANQEKSINPLIDAQGYLQSAFSDYRIFLSEKQSHRETVPVNIKKSFEEINQSLDHAIENEDLKSLNYKKLQDDLENLSNIIFEIEADIWKYEALRYNVLAVSRDRNKLYFYSILLFFFISEIALIYFIYQRLKLSTQINQQHRKLLISTRLSTLGEMSAELAHEINNPLMVINGRLKIIENEIAKKGMVTPDDLKNNLDIISRNSLRIEQIVKTFSFLSKTGENDPYEIIPLSNIFGDLKKLFEKRLEDDNVKFSLPANINGIQIKARLVQILQVFTNLINNSLHAIEKRTDRWISIKVDFSHETVIFKITDCGEGIPKDVVSNLFDAFYTTKSYKEGTGLGLSICQKIIQEHNGKIYYNDKSLNTEFVIELPKAGPSFLSPT